MDWTRTRTTSYEYWEVDRATWGDRTRLDSVLAMSITQDAATVTRACASMETVEGWDPSERVVRVYMVAEQSGRSERTCLGTFCSRKTAYEDDGRKGKSKWTLHSTVMPLYGSGDAKALVPLGYTVPQGSNCAAAAAAICAERGIAPVVASRSGAALASPYTAAPGQTWAELASSIAAAGGMEVRPDAYGRILVAPPVRAGAPKWTFSDGNSSIRLPGMGVDLDLSGVPNVCEVVWREGGRTIAARAVNDDPASPVSTAARGYEAVMRVEDPDELQAGATRESALLVAGSRLRAEARVNAVVSIGHAWCGIGAGDPVRVEAGDMTLDGVVRSVDIELDNMTSCATKVDVPVERGML